MSNSNHTTNQFFLFTAMDQYNTKEDVLKLGIVDPELEEVSEHATFF